MPYSVQKELDRILQKFVRLEFDDILQDLDNILANMEITKEEKIKAKYLQSNLHYFMSIFGYERGSREIGLQLAQEILEESKNLGDDYLIFVSNLTLLNKYFFDNQWHEFQKLMKEVLMSFDELEPQNDIFYLNIKTIFLIFQGIHFYSRVYTGETPSDEELEKGMQIWIETEKICEKNNLYLNQISTLINIRTVYTTRGELDLALETSQKIVNIVKKLGNKIAIGAYLSSLAWAYFAKNDYKKFYEITNERLTILKETELKPLVAEAYNDLGFYYSIIGEYDDALDNYERSIAIYKESKRENSVAFVQQNIGNVYYLEGDFEKASELYDQAYTVLKENQPQGWYEILSDLASLSTQNGDLDRALDYLDQLNTIHKGFQNQFGISEVLTKQSLVFWQKGMQEQALSYMKDSLEIRQKIDNKNLIAVSLSYLIQFNIEINDLDAAKKYFESLELINKETKIKQVSQNCKFTEALILKTSSDLRDRLKAEVLFEHLIEEDTSYPIRIQVFLHLCDLLILEMKETNDSKILEKINKHITELQILSEKNNSHILLVETLRLRAQLALIEFDIDNARTLLLKAQNIAQEHGFERLVLDLLKEQEKLTRLSIELRNLEKTSPTISQRMSVIEISDTLSSVKRTSITETVKKEEEFSKKLFSIQI